MASRMPSVESPSCVDLGAIEIDVDLPLGAALHLDRRHAVDLLEPGLDDVARELPDLGSERPAAESVYVSTGADPTSKRATDGSLTSFGSLARARLRDAFADLRGGVLQVDAQLEDDDGRREALARRRAQAVDAVERNDRVFDGLGDKLLDLARRGARIRHVDDDDRERDVGEEIGPEP